jgi:hypothetical protein
VYSTSSIYFRSYVLIIIHKFFLVKGIGTIIRMSHNFWGGIIYGFIAAWIIGAILNVIREERGKWGRQNRPLNTYSDAEQPNLTAAGIVRDSWLGVLGCIFWTLVLIAVCYLLLFFANLIGGSSV